MQQTIRSPMIVIALGVAATGFAAEVRAATVPFTETFNAGSANWFDSPGTTPLAWNVFGGPDGSPFASTPFNFVNSAANDTPVLFRAQDEFASSGGAFVGDWVTGGVTVFNASVRQNSGVPLNFFVRFASPNNFPGADNVFPISVPSGTWTSLSAALPNPGLIFEGPFSYGQVFGNVGHVQIGVSVPQGLAGVDNSFSFDVDNVGIVPEPTSLALLLLGVSVVGRKVVRRRLGSA
jgi:hypothetical protein